jgi:hypothetical protein
MRSNDIWRVWFTGITFDGGKSLAVESWEFNDTCGIEVGKSVFYKKELVGTYSGECDAFSELFEKGNNCSLKTTSRDM